RAWQRGKEMNAVRNCPGSCQTCHRLHSFIPHTLTWVYRRGLQPAGARAGGLHSRDNGGKGRGAPRTRPLKSPCRRAKVEERINGASLSKLRSIFAPGGAFLSSLRHASAARWRRRKRSLGLSSSADGSAHG